MPIRVLPYKMTSKSAIRLRDALTEKVGERVYFLTPEYEVQSRDFVVRWGNGFDRLTGESNALGVLNPMNVIARCVNKIDCFERLDGFDVRKVKWTQRISTASLWAENGHKVFCRTRLEGRDGQGLVVANTPRDVVGANLYTRGEQYDEEYRVHLFKHEPLTSLIKVPKEGANMDIRTGGNGWNYHREPDCPAEVLQVARAASKALQMCLGAIDIIHNETTGKAWFLEANTAPELGPHTAPLYAAKIKEAYDAARR